MDGILASPDAVQLAQVISQATAPAFMLGAGAGFVSILLGRMSAIVDRIRHLNEIDEADRSRSHLKADLPRLRRRLRHHTRQPSSTNWRRVLRFIRIHS